MCIFSLRICAAFHTGHGALLIQSAAMQNEISQYTLRYRYVTGSWLRPDTRKNPLTRPDGLVCSRHPLTDKL